MTRELVRRGGSSLLYLGKRSAETRFVVLGWHNVKEHEPFRMVEVTYYPRRGAYRPGIAWELPRRWRHGPFVVFKHARHNWTELLVGWQRRRKWG